MTVQDISAIRPSRPPGRKDEGRRDQRVSIDVPDGILRLAVKHPQHPVMAGQIREIPRNGSIGLPKRISVIGPSNGQNPAEKLVLINPEIGEAGDIDTDVVTLRFANGALGLIDNSRQAVYGYDQRLEVFCSGGMALAENESEHTAVTADQQGYRSARLPYFFMNRYAEAYVTEVREFIECVRDDKMPPVTGRDGRLAVVMAHAAIRSWKENRPIKLSEIAAV